jgi:hypothetical protein
MTLRAPLGAAFVVLVLLLAASTAGAAPGPINPLQLGAAEAVYGPTVGVAPDGSGEVIFGEQTEAGVRLAAAARGADGVYGPLQQLTRTPNAEAAPSILFDPAGGAFAAWGIGTNGAQPEWARRPAGGLFGAPANVLSCGRFLAYDGLPGGQTAFACSAASGAPPNDDFVRFGEFGPTAESIGATGNLSGAGIDDDFLHPQVSVGADGTLAVAWYQEDATSGKNKVQVAVRPAGAASFEALKTLVEATSPDQDQLDDIEVLADGTVLALVSREPGLELYSRPPGIASPWSAAQPLLSDDAYGLLTADASGRVTVAATHDAGGIAEPRTIAVATRPAGGSFGAFVPIASGDVTARALETAPDGTTFLDWGDYGGSAVALRGAVAPPGGAFGAPITIGVGNGHFSAALDPGGNVLAAWGQEVATDDERLLVGGIDSGAPPTFAAVDIPSAVLAGAPVKLSAAATDWSGIREVRWTFAGGDVAKGATVTHSFGTPGVATVQVTAVDRAGNEATTSRDVRVVAEGAAATTPAAGTGAAPGDRRAPKLGLRTRGKLKLSRFLRSVTARVSVDEPSRVEVTLLARARSAHLASASASGLNLILASRQLKRVDGTRVVRLRPNRRLLGGAARLRVVLRVTAVDASGNQAAGQRTIRVG